MFNYYTPRFPFPQGRSAGPYSQFVGKHQHVQCVVMPVEHRGRVASPGHVARIPVTQSLWAGRTAPNHRIGCRPCRHRRFSKKLGALGDSSAGLPAGSQLVYSATWPTYFMGSMSSSVGAMIAPVLKSQAIFVDQETDIGWLTPGKGFTLHVHTTADRNAQEDVKAVIDGAIYNAIKVMPQSSITTAALANTAPPVTGSPTPGGTQQAQWVQNYNDSVAAGDSAGAAYWLSLIQGGAQPFSLGTFLTNNWMWLAAGVFGLVAVKEMA